MQNSVENPQKGSNSNQNNGNAAKFGVSVVIPVFNEENSIKEVAVKLQRIMSRSEYNYELIFVNDNSSDNSKIILESIKGIILINHSMNHGYGHSLKTGIKNAEHECIVIVDADGTYPIESIPGLLKYSQNYEIVSGMRVGKQSKIPLLRRPAKFMLRMLANFLVGVKIPDLNCGLRVIKKNNVMKYFNILPNRFSFTTTHLLSCIAAGEEIKFVKIKYHKRKGKSTIHPIKDFARFIAIIFKEGLLINPIKFFSTISFFFLLFAVSIFFYSRIVLGQIMDISIVILISGAVQIFLFGLLADLVIRKLKV